MKNVVLAGASGVVGARVLHHLLGHADVGRVTALGRRQLAQRHAKLVSKVVDLQSEGALSLETPDDVGLALCCLGTTMKQAGSPAAFRAVDHDAVVNFARAALHKGAQRFVLVSALGANPKSGNFYMKVKGEAEDALESLGFAQLTIVRPSLLDDEGARTDHRLGERLALPLARAVFSVVGKTHRYAPITVDAVARAVVRLAFDETKDRTRVVESDRLHGIAA
jgi:uncharacterized protein YbjT (DUF2867 family)